MTVVKDASWVVLVGDDLMFSGSPCCALAEMKGVNVGVGVCDGVGSATPRISKTSAR